MKEDSGKTEKVDVAPAFEPEKTYLVAAGTDSLGGDPVAVDVKNGKVIRLRPLHYDWKYSKEELAPTMWKWEARGKVFESPAKSLPSHLAIPYKNRAYSPNRIKYPMKRVDWDPNGERNPQNRGKSKFKRISWDEATDIIASEIKRIHDKYGTMGIYAASRAHGQAKNIQRCHWAHSALLKLFGPYTEYDNNPDSWEGWYWGGLHVVGDGSFMGHMMPAENMIQDVSENTEMIVWQGGDWETTPAGMSGQFLSTLNYWFTELGIKQVYVSPDLNYAAAVHGDKWIPVLPNTDAALQLGIIYTWIKEDTYDKEYVSTHTVGFDKIKAYVMGEEDGVPKTPRWASPKCGVPEWTIKALARAWAKKRTCSGHFYGGSFQRGPYSHEPARLEYISLGMQGVGKPGIHQLCATGAIPPKFKGTRVMGMLPAEISLNQKIPLTKVPDAILNPPVEWHGGGMSSTAIPNQFEKRTYPLPKEQGGTEIHMYWTDCPCMTTCWNNGNHWIEAFRSPKIEFLLAEHPWFEGDCAYADIVMPGTTVLEDEDIMFMRRRPGTGSSREFVCIQEGAMGHIAETMSDYELVSEIAKKLEKYGGIYTDAYKRYTGGMTVQEKIKGAFEFIGPKDLISWEEFKEKGYYCYPVDPDWKKDPPGLRKFYEDPQKNPRQLPSGKLEFYSERLAENFPDDKERGPHPKWVPGGPGWFHDESLEGERAKKYPLLIIPNHPRWRFHAQCDDIPWFKELPTGKVRGYDGYMYEPIWINPKDAASRGIENGEIVKIFNERGIVLVGAYVTERIRPGTVYVDHGARVDKISDEIDRGGAINLISPRRTTSKYAWGQATSGYLVDVQKLGSDEMESWRKKYPEAFARAYDPAYGLMVDSWMEEKEA